MGTTHCTPYDYDTYVPLYFAGITIHDRMLEDSVETVDIAPTRADILRIRMDGVDGRV